ncbi:hypothetical protein SAMD00019534_108520 [Acytostelium subglobosum LB1]|uniref:hypothetical protein n=1 Tax=Acytostelium subglobosum LB1 TaxID=1410327 RepID=UPI000644F731|nr:hypothetical protein SAMD00019534_108520 [Acytostelium subglobosum LB1]GAM27676.1 hypothetical protein SAMD00019534_108520 [Acytostelium subglobosum LB1]|eukprot:XP_012749335.1 hypothetical protein SAMD00019534_108520 [Acytostelium subglobosum LB1]
MIRIHIDKTSNTPADMKRREQFIRMVMRDIPNVVTYNFVSDDWSVHVRRPSSDPWNAIVVERTLPFDKQTIQFIKLDQSGPLAARLVDDKKRLIDEAEHHKLQVAELNKQIVHWRSECERLTTRVAELENIVVPAVPSDSMDQTMNDVVTRTASSTTTSSTQGIIPEPKVYTSLSNNKRSRKKYE